MSSVDNRIRIEKNASVPETRKPFPFLILCVITLLLILPYLLGVPVPGWLELSIFGFFVIITGIPHGAVDHIVAAGVYNLEQSRRDHLRFYGTYLITMLALGLVWILSPVLGFVIFIVISVYHFGQGDLSYITGTMSRSGSTVLYISRGLFLVGLPVLLHPEITFPIIESAVRSDFGDGGFLTSNGGIISAILIIQHLFLLFFIPNSAPVSIFKEFLLIILLALLFYAAHPLVSFGVYFGLWHSLNHFYELRDHLKEGKQSFSFFSLYTKTIPFTLISFAGLAILWFLQGAIGIENQMISLLFILISVLTLPHMLLIDKMYRKGHQPT